MLQYTKFKKHGLKKTNFGVNMEDNIKDIKGLRTAKGFKRFLKYLFFTGAATAIAFNIPALGLDLGLFGASPLIGGITVGGIVIAATTVGFTIINTWQNIAIKARNDDILEDKAENMMEDIIDLRQSKNIFKKARASNKSYTLLKYVNEILNRIGKYNDAKYELEKILDKNPELSIKSCMKKVKKVVDEKPIRKAIKKELDDCKSDSDMRLLIKDKHGFDLKTDELKVSLKKIVGKEIESSDARMFRQAIIGSIKNGDMLSSNLTEIARIAMGNEGMKITKEDIAKMVYEYYFENEHANIFDSARNMYIAGVRGKIKNNSRIYAPLAAAGVSGKKKNSQNNKNENNANKTEKNADEVVSIFFGYTNE